MTEPGSISPDGEDLHADSSAPRWAPAPAAYAGADDTPADGYVADPVQESAAYAETAYQEPVYAEPVYEEQAYEAPDDAPAEEPVVPSRPPRPNDPIIRWLILGIAGVIIFWLVSVLSAMMFGMFQPPISPRTSAERDLMVANATVQSGKANTQTYAGYIGTLISVGQYAKAQQAIDQALKTAKTDRSFLYARQADLSLANKDYQSTVNAADKAIAEAKKETNAYMEANVQANRKPTAGLRTPQSYMDASLAKAEALLASKQFKAAIKTFDLYLIEQPIDADILTQRGDAKVQVGDKKGAAADYRTALKFIPDYQPALSGLKKIGASR